MLSERGEEGRGGAVGEGFRGLGCRGEGVRV